MVWFLTALKLLFKFPALIPTLWRIKSLIKNFPKESWTEISEDVLFILRQVSRLAGGQFAVVAQLILWLEAALKQHPHDAIPLSDLKAHCEGLCNPQGKRFIP